MGCLEWDGARGKGIDDHLAIVGPEGVLDEIAHVDFAGSAWRKDLLRAEPPMNTTEGRILPVLANAIAAFRHAPEWGGVLAFNGVRPKRRRAPWRRRTWSGSPTW